MITVVQEGKIGFLNEEAQIVIPPQYEKVYGSWLPIFHNEYCILTVNGYFGMINKKGETIVPFQYDAILKLEDTRKQIQIKPLR